MDLVIQMRRETFNQLEQAQQPRWDVSDYVGFLCYMGWVGIRDRRCSLRPISNVILLCWYLSTVREFHSFGNL
jgi:hypothetical protein